jgi:ubiquitin-associated protein 1
MSHFGDFMDGVPVKISEKYKRPPSIALPYSVSECPIRVQHFVDNVKYCSTFETNVLSKLKELRSAKETKKNERRHRLQLLEEAKQKKLDAIAAAEAEEKLKQLSVSEVSYPSTDELSAMTPDEKVEQNCDITSNKECEEQSDINNEVAYSTPQESHPDILQPIQVKANYNLNSLLDDPDPLQELKMAAKIKKIPQYRNIETLTYKDFENDTSSPFDNVELKTINDMELLAQVLQSQRDSTTSCPQGYITEQTYIPNCASQAQVEGMTYLPNAFVEQSVQGPSVMYLPQHYPVSNGYYTSPENTCDNIPVENMNMYMPNYQYYVPTNPFPMDTAYYNNQLPTTSADINPVRNGSTYIPQPYYFHVPQIPYCTENNAYNTVQDQNMQNIENQNVSNNSQNTMKSRSRSVPDIVRELNEELASAKLRANERSQNVSPAPVNVPRSSSSSDKKEEKRHRRKAEHLPNPYDKMPPVLQNMCQKIHGMGFPLDRVARVCGLLGDNDKKVTYSIILIIYLKKKYISIY